MLVWNNIRPELEQLIFEAQVQRESEARYNRRALRIGEFKPFWSIIAKHLEEPLKGDVLPTFNQACKLPCVKAMLSEDDWNLQVTQQRVETILVNGNVTSDIVSFQVDVRRILVRLLRPDVTLDLLQENSATPQLADDFNRHILNRAYHFFNLPITKSIVCNDVISHYPQALSHSSLRLDSDHVTWTPETLLKMVPNPKVKEVAILLMQKLGLNPVEATHDDLDALDGQLVCKCDAASARRPMNWTELVRTNNIWKTYPVVLIRQLLKVMHYLDDEQSITHYQQLKSTSICVAISPKRHSLMATRIGAFETVDQLIRANIWDEVEKGGTYTM